MTVWLGRSRGHRPRSTCTVAFGLSYCLRGSTGPSPAPENLISSQLVPCALAEGRRRKRRLPHTRSSPTTSFLFGRFYTAFTRPLIPSDLVESDAQSTLRFTLLVRS